MRACLPLIVASFLVGCYQSYPRLDPDEVCEPDPFDAVRVDPGIYIVLDRSRSMCFPLCPGSVDWDYWTPAVEGITSIVSELEHEVAFGLALFPDPDSDDDDTNCSAPSPAWSVPVRLDNASHISTILTEAPWPFGPHCQSKLPSPRSSVALEGAYT